MKLFICGEMRKMLNAYFAMDAAYARKLFSTQKLVQVDYFAPIVPQPAAATLRTSNNSQASTSKGVVDDV
eukprot:2458322-Pleurochrysis_carterae.AAC.1